MQSTKTTVSQALLIISPKLSNYKGAVQILAIFFFILYEGSPLISTDREVIWPDMLLKLRMEIFSRK